MKSRNSYILALALSSVALSAEAQEVDLMAALLSALHAEDTRILELLNVPAGHTVDSITYDVSQGFGAGRINYTYGMQVTPSPAADLSEWKAVCSPTTATFDQTSVQAIQQGSTYENTQTTDLSIVVEVNAKANYVNVELDMNTTTSFDTSETTTTTQTQQNMKAVKVSNVETHEFSEFSCADPDRGPSYMNGLVVIYNNQATTLDGDPKIPYTYEVYPAGNEVIVTTKAPYTTSPVPAPNVKVEMWDKKGKLQWTSIDPYKNGDHQYYDGNTDGTFPDKADIRTVKVSTGTSYGAESLVKICKNNNDCYDIPTANEMVDVPGHFQNKNLNSLIVRNMATRTQTTGGELTKHTMQISEIFNEMDHSIATLDGTYTAQAIDNVATTSSIQIWGYDPVNVPSNILAMCGATQEIAVANYGCIE